MTFKEIKNFFSGLPDDLELDTKETKVENSEEEKATELSAREAAVKAAEKALDEKLAKLAEAVAEAPKETNMETDTAVLNEASKTDKADVEQDEVTNSGPSERELALEAELAELRQKDIKRDAEKFADGEIKAERAFPAEREGLIALFMQASIDDTANEVKVSFKSGEETIEGSRVDTLKALYSVRKPHNLTYEEVSDLNANVLVATYSEDEDYLGEAEIQAKEYAARRNKIKK